MENKPRIGVIGLGIMGLAMAKNLSAVGYDVLATSRSHDRLKLANAAGLKTGSSPQEVAKSSDAIIIIVTDPKAVQNVLFGPGGIFEIPVRGKTLIQMSTIDVKSTLHFSRDAAEREMAFLDCPVTGSKIQVEAAQLILLAGGPAALIEQWRPVLLSLGKAIVHAGDVGQGTALKLCMNLIVAQMTTALVESKALAEALGIDPARIFEVIGHSPALNCGYFKIKEKALLNEDYTPAFSLANMLKDVKFMCDAAKERSQALPVTEAVRLVMEHAAHKNLGEKDLSVIAEVLKTPPLSR